MFVNSIVLGAITETQEGSVLGVFLGKADTALLSLLVLDVAPCDALAAQIEERRRMPAE